MASDDDSIDFDAIDAIEREYLRTRRNRPKRIVVLVDRHHTRWAFEDDFPDLDDPFHPAWRLVDRDEYAIPRGHVVSRLVRIHLLQDEESDGLDEAPLSRAVGEKDGRSEVDPTS